MSERQCIDCGDTTLNPERCRSCDIEYLLDSMQCSTCQHMRYTRDERLAPIAESFWGERCECDPRPPSIYETRKTSRARP